MSDLVFKPGDKWVMRNGQVATIYPFVADGKHITAYWPGRTTVYRSDGRYWFHDQESEFDLIRPAAEGE